MSVSLESPAARLLLVGAGVAAIAALTISAAGSARTPDNPATVRDGNELMAELRRCRAMGEAAGTDGRCAAAWRASRKAFLDGGSRP